MALKSTIFKAELQISNMERHYYKAHSNLSVVDLPAESTRELALLSDRSMRLHCTIQDGEVWLSNEIDSVHVAPKVRMRSD